MEKGDSRIPGGGEEVEDAAEDTGQLRVSLGHQQHHGVAAGGTNRGAVTAT